MQNVMRFMILLSLVMSISTYASDKENDSILNSVKEIFVKGSIADERLFLVLGFENAHRFADAAVDSIVDKENLVDIKNDVVESFGDVADFYTKDEYEDDSQYVDSVKGAAQFSRKHLGRILSSPWKSLKKIPESFKVGFERANTSLNDSSNPLVGSTKWAGHAIWTVIKGSYYLVIETPAVFAGEAILGAGALPVTTLGLPVASAGLLTLRLGFEAIQLSYEVTKAILAASAAVTGYAYAAISTTVASGVVILGAAAMATVKGAYKLVSFPFRYGRVSSVEAKTQIHYRELEEFTNAISQNINKELLDKYKVDTAVAYNSMDTFSAHRYYSGKIVFKAHDSNKDALIINVGIDFNSDKDEQFIKVSAYSKSAHTKTLAQTRAQRKEIEKELAKDIELILADLIEKYSADEEE